MGATGLRVTDCAAHRPARHTRRASRLPIRARFRPHPRGFGFADPVADDTLTEIPAHLTDEAGRRTEVDRIFVPPPTAKGLLDRKSVV